MSMYFTDQEIQQLQAEGAKLRYCPGRPQAHGGLAFERHLHKKYGFATTNWPPDKIKEFRRRYHHHWFPHPSDFAEEMERINTTISSVIWDHNYISVHNKSDLSALIDKDAIEARRDGRPRRKLQELLDEAVLGQARARNDLAGNND
jgi:hypothetical protein